MIGRLGEQFAPVDEHVRHAADEGFMRKDPVARRDRDNAGPLRLEDIGEPMGHCAVRVASRAFDHELPVHSLKERLVPFLQGGNPVPFGLRDGRRSRRAHATILGPLSRRGPTRGHQVRSGTNVAGSVEALQKRGHFPHPAEDGAIAR